ncbi:threonine-phosphate decarboxylase CobD [Brevundimonas sp.]|uniref:threonine-phosphate decarboxylase CobD n=1 Tax=Brevundimonas sp. TaxID=1871086 RepID=UPI00289C620D|nr:threonine-phosphate decarboxylase CobD [Brevundimonas sp.]
MLSVRPHKEAIRHGGGLRAASYAHPEVTEPWLDLSTGINPVPYPAQPASMTERGRLPDPMELAVLEDVAARYFKARPERVAPAAGAETVIRLLPVLLGRVTVDIVGPTYRAHAEAWQAAFLAPMTIGVDQAHRSGSDVLVIVNPNNPDGYVFSKAELLRILRKRETQGRWLVIDESFGECSPENSMADVISDRLIVLRSFGKFFGLAGVRLGFAIASPSFKASLRALTGDWPVCADALAMGRQAYTDMAWSETTLALLQGQAAQLDEVLNHSGFEVIGGTCLFRLARHSRAHDWFWKLCRRGILTRPFDHTPDVLRFGLPRPDDFYRLQRALEAGL